jgi:LCP family protein required for cell wall assembly
VGIGVVFAFVSHLITPRLGEHTGNGKTESMADVMKDIGQIVSNPRDGFPGKDRITILGMGIDDNWTDNDIVFTKGARTDTLFILTLDLANKTATMLSIPRDTYTHIAGTNRSTKINAAYATGGPERSRATVEELTGIRCDYYLLLNIDATKHMVDDLGGVDLNVEHEMHYHDKWGHLNIDLMPGQQHLNGDQAVGFVRYRHPDSGAKLSPEDGDDKRMARQHILLKVLVDKAKSYTNIAKANFLIDEGMKYIRTDLSRTQLLDLFALYRNVQREDIKTASLPCEDFRGSKGEWFVKVDPGQLHAYINWLVNGDETASRGITKVIVRNGTNINGLAAAAADELRSLGYTDVTVSSVRKRSSPSVQDVAQSSSKESVTEMVDSGVPNSNSMSDIQKGLGLSGASLSVKPVKPNSVGWAPPATITITLGDDYARVANLKSKTGNQSDDNQDSADANGANGTPSNTAN